MVNSVYLFDATIVANRGMHPLPEEWNRYIESLSPRPIKKVNEPWPPLSSDCVPINRPNEFVLLSQCIQTALARKRVDCSPAMEAPRYHDPEDISVHQRKQEADLEPTDDSLEDTAEDRPESQESQSAVTLRRKSAAAAQPNTSPINPNVPKTVQQTTLRNLLLFREDHYLLDLWRQRRARRSSTEATGNTSKNPGFCKGAWCMRKESKSLAANKKFFQSKK